MQWEEIYVNNSLAEAVLPWQYIGGLVQKRRNSTANALELRLFCKKLLIW